MAPLVNAPIPSIAEATDNAARLLQQSLAMAVQASDPANVLPSDLELARSNVRALSFMQGMGLHGAYRYLRDFVARQAVPGMSASVFLDGWLDTYSMARKPASLASGTAAGTGESGTLLEAGTLLTHEASGWQFRVQADVAVASGAVVATLLAVQVGAKGNLPAGTQLRLLSTVAGVDAVFTLTNGSSGGADEEKDPEALFRLRQRLAFAPMGGSPADYALWALSLPGITRAWGLRNPAGPTSAGVIIMADANLPNGLPTAAQQAQVFGYITDPRRGPPDELFVIIPTAQVINVSLRLNVDTTATRAAAEAALRDLFFRESVPGGSIPHSHLFEVVSSVQGEVDHQFTAPAMTTGGVFTASSFSHLLVLGSVTFVS
jgi:uncharacterized phage protein gp47/JayE